MNLQVLLEKGKPRILLQALLVRYGGLLPLHRVGEFSWHHSLGYGCQVEHPRGVRRDVDFDHLVPVVVYVKVGVQEELHTLILIHLSYKAPQGKLIKIHLEVVVVFNGMFELGLVLSSQLHDAELLIVPVDSEVEFERRIHHAVALKNLSEIFQLVLLLLCLAEGERVELIRLAWVVKGSDFVCIHRHGVVLLVCRDRVRGQDRHEEQPRGRIS
mmetsp:Transcript_4572/g.8004  ORF Transcript_4572/g.8004 Transcript_4572/m.8004 type:complete len:214 (-) Transcript_4572:61-702(-)